jgi:hypothetical protein
MLHFLDWLTHNDTATLLRLLEAADYFDPSAYNPVFVTELEKLLHRIHDPDVLGPHLRKPSMRLDLLDQIVLALHMIHKPRQITWLLVHHVIDGHAPELSKGHPHIQVLVA